MTPTRTTALASLLILLGAGCGGDGTGTPTPVTPGVERFAGRYTGTYVGDPDNGTVALTVATEGTITGTATDSRFGSGGVVSESSVRNDGTVRLKVTYPSGDGIPFVTDARGTMTLSETRLRGVLQEDHGTFTTPLTYELTRS